MFVRSGGAEAAPGRMQAFTTVSVCSRFCSQCGGGVAVSPAAADFAAADDG
jgi:hypothetical protein